MIDIPSAVKNPELREWVAEMVELLEPNAVHWCDGSQAEYDRLCEEMVASGTFTRLNPKKRPNCFWRGAMKAMWPGSKTALTFVRSPRSMRGRPTTGWRHAK